MHLRQLTPTADDPPLPALSAFATALGASSSLDEVVEALMPALEALGFAHAILYFLDEHGDRLFALASHGYAQSGVGAEVKLGEGPVGIVAQSRRAVRFGGLRTQRVYARRARAETEGDAGAAREIAPPGLADPASVLVVPMLARKKVLGTIMVESEEPAAYTDVHEQLLSLVATLGALAIEALREPEPDAEESAVVVPEQSEARPVERRAVYYASDDSVLIDDEYVIKSLPGRVLYKLLRDKLERGRAEFTNKELRLDASLKLPEIRDNLESRLILLRKRLDEKFPFLRITPTGRGRFRFDVDGKMTLHVAR